MHAFLLRSNILPKFYLSSYVHGILRKWVVAFPYIKYMLLLKVNIFNSSPFQTFTQIPFVALCVIMLFSGSELLPFHVLSVFSCCKCMYIFSFLMFYPNSTCRFMHMVFSASELLSSYVLKYMLLMRGYMYFFFKFFPIFYPNSIYAHGIHSW